MKHILPALLLPILLAACEVQGPGFPPVGGPPRPGPSAAVVADACGAARFASLVGQPKAVADRTAFPQGTRVILPGMAVTMDYREDRLNVLIDGNATVERVYCG